MDGSRVRREVIPNGRLIGGGKRSKQDVADDALVRISPGEIRKKGRVPKNGNIFFTIFQTFMSGMDEEGNPAPYFGEYPPDFFDLIVIDECHRGGANDGGTNLRSCWICFSVIILARCFLVQKLPALDP